MDEARGVLMDGRPFIERFMSRRYLQSWGVILIATALLILGYIGEQTWALVVGGAFAGYTWSNIRQDRIYSVGGPPLGRGIDP